MSPQSCLTILHLTVVLSTPDATGVESMQDLRAGQPQAHGAAGSRSATSRLPMPDDIKVETHPSAKIPPALFSYEDYNANLPKPDPMVVKPAKHDPWFPFRSRLDFDVAEFMQAHRFNNQQSKEFMELIERIRQHPREYHLRDVKEVNDLWDTAALMHDASVSSTPLSSPFPVVLRR